VKHVKRGNWLKSLFLAKTLFPPQDNLNYYILICFIQLEQPLSGENIWFGSSGQLLIERLDKMVWLREIISLQEMIRTMLNDKSTPKHLWAEAMNIACYLQNIIYIRPILKRTPYELWKGRKSNISYFHPFGCQCFIVNTKNNLGKFDSKCDNGILLEYS